MIAYVLVRLYSAYAMSLMIIAFITHYITTFFTYALPGHGRNVDYAIARTILKIMFILGGVKIIVKGKEHIPTDRPFILASNHQSVLDIFAYYIAIDQPIAFFAKKELETMPFIGRVIKYQHFLVDRKNPKQGLMELKKVGQLIKKGKNAIIFPEGTRTYDEKIAPLKRGLFSLSAETNTPVIPCYIEGMYRVLNRHSRLIRPGKVSITICPPREPDTSTTNEKQRAIDLMHTVHADLLACEAKAFSNQQNLNGSRVPSKKKSQETNEKESQNLREKETKKPNEQESQEQRET